MGIFILFSGSFQKYLYVFLAYITVILLALSKCVTAKMVEKDI